MFSLLVMRLSSDALCCLSSDTLLLVVGSLDGGSAARLGAALAGGLPVELPEVDGLVVADVAVVCTVCAALPAVTTAARRNSERPSWTVTLTRRALMVVAKAALLPPVPPVMRWESPVFWKKAGPWVLKLPLPEV